MFVGGTNEITRAEHGTGKQKPYVASEQVRVRAGSGEDEGEAVVIYTVNEKPVGLKVAFTHSLVSRLVTQGVVAVLFGKGLLGSQNSHNLAEQPGVKAAFDCLPVISLKLSMVFNRQHLNPP